MIVDANAELGDELGAEALLRLMTGARIDRAIVSASPTDPLPPVPDRPIRLMRSLLRSPLRGIGLARLDRFTRGGGLHFAGNVVRVRHVINNDRLFETAARSGGRLVPFAVATPHVNRNATRQLESWIAARRIAGCKAFAWYHALEPGRDLIAIGCALARARMPLILQLGANSRTKDFGTLLTACPDLTVILAHLGMPLFESAWRAVRDDSRLFLDVSGPWLDASTALAAIRAVGAHKAVFGSNAPLGLRVNGSVSGYSYGAVVAQIAGLGLRTREMDLIMGETMAQILERAGD